MTVDEILNGEETVKEEPKSILPTYCYDLPVSAIVVSILGVFAAIYNVTISISGISNVLGLQIYGDSFLARLPSILIFLGFSAYWVIITTIFICRFLKIFDYEFKCEKILTIVAFVFGFIMLFAQGLDFSPINYGMFMFSFALLLGTFHGYKVPYKIFFGLAILFSCIFGIINVFTEGGTDSIQIYGFILRFIRAIGFYVFYGLLEKFSSEYEGVEE